MSDYNLDHNLTRVVSYEECDKFITKYGEMSHESSVIDYFEVFNKIHSEYVSWKENKTKEKEIPIIEDEFEIPTGL